jgi:hypothetical protein
MVDYQTISIVLTGIGIIIALAYYGLQIRNQNITRRAQLFMQIYQQMNSEESNRTWAEVMNLECNNYNEFLRKYDSSVNPDSYGKRSHVWFNFNAIGVLVEEGLIDPDIVFRLTGPLVVMQWQKWYGVIEEMRKQENIPDALSGFEYLYTEMKKILEEKEHPEPAYGQPFKHHPELKT